MPTKSRTVADGGTAGTVYTAEQLQPLFAALQAVQAGDFSVRLPADWTGVPGKIADAFNEIVEFNHHMSLETARVSRAVGKDLGPFFDAWGVPTSHAARDSIKDLPRWMPENFPPAGTTYTFPPSLVK